MTDMLGSARRWQLSAVFMVTLLVAFFDRLNITYALPLMAAEYGWNEAEVQRYGSQLLGLFYIAYGFANVFLTPLASRFGTRRSLMIIICLWALFTALGAWVSQFIMLLLATRVLLGLSEGVHVPMMMHATKHWFPPQERSRANSIVAAGIFIALLLAPLVLVPLMSQFGWRVGFHLLALVGLLVSLPLVYFFVYDDPDAHPRLSESERRHIAAGLAEEHAGEVASLRWRDVPRVPGYLWVIAIGATNNLVGAGLTSWIPSYFTLRRGIPFEDIAWLVVGPSAFSLLGLLLWAHLGDRLNRRAALTGIGAIVAGLAFMVALNVESLFWVIACFSFGVFFLASYQASEFAILQRLLPRDKFASLAGVYNGLAIIVGGGFGPYLMSPIIGSGEGTWVLAAVAGFSGLLLLGLHWRYRC